MINWTAQSRALSFWWYDNCEPGDLLLPGTTGPRCTPNAHRKSGTAHVYRTPDQIPQPLTRKLTILAYHPSRIKPTSLQSVSCHLRGYQFSTTRCRQIKLGRRASEGRHSNQKNKTSLIQLSEQLTQHWCRTLHLHLSSDATSLLATIQNCRTTNNPDAHMLPKGPQYVTANLLPAVCYSCSTL